MKREDGHLRRAGRVLSVACCAAALAIPALGCDDDRSSSDGDVRSGSPAETLPAAGAADTGPFLITRDVLFRVRDGGRQPILAVPGAGPAADTLALGPDSGGALGTPRFRRAVAAPDSAWVAWEVVGGGAWVGVVAPVAPNVRTLGHWTEALPDTLLWSPAGRYLAVRLRGPEGRLALSVFDTETGERLALPWETECAATQACDVTDLRWVGGTLLDVEIRPGPDEPAVPYEVNVEELTPMDVSEDEEELRT